MKLVVASCWSYRDCWLPFLALLERFWPDHPPVVLLTDELPYDLDRWFGVRVFCGPRSTKWQWCQLVAEYARTVDEPILLMQEDFWLTEPVHPELIEHGLQQMGIHGAGCVRLYPSPGGTEDIGDPFFASVPRATINRISCMAALWQPEYLFKVAQGSRSTTGEAGDFENLGTPFADTLPEPVLAFRRDVRPWPMEYLASAISRGLWNPDAIALCRDHNIELDRSMRAVSG